MGTYKNKNDKKQTKPYLKNCGSMAQFVLELIIKVVMI